jgi:tripartite-type tricarboxylate transporter receptor subunit TctC
MHHLSMEAIKAHFKLDMAHIPFRGTGQSVPALLGGHVGALFSAYPSLGGGVESKQVTIVAENGATRSPQFPDVPAVAEFIPGIRFCIQNRDLRARWHFDSVLNLISSHVMAIANEADTINRFSAVGIEAAGSRPDEFRKVFEEEILRVEATVKAAGIAPQ